MAVGLAPDVANDILAALCGGVPWTPPAQIWIQLHVGDPGEAGTANPAGNSLRLLATFAPTADGVVANASLLMWNNVPVTELYTRFTAWDADTAGNFQFSGTVTSSTGQPIANGDDFYSGPGVLVVSFTVAA